MKTKLISVIIGVTIAVIVLASVLMPVIQQSTETNNTYTNDGFFRMESAKSTDTGTKTIEWDHTDPYKIKIGTETYTFTTSTFTVGSAVTIVGNVDDGVNSHFLVRLFYWSATNIAFQLTTNGTVTGTASLTDDQDVTITLANGTMSFVISESGEDDVTYTKSYTEAYYINPSGKSIMKHPTDKSYIADDSRIVALGLTGYGEGESRVTFAMCIDGTYDDLEITGKDGAATATFGDAVVTKTTVSESIDCYQIEKIQFTATMSGTEYDATYNYFIVPYEVTVEKSQHLSDGQNAIINAIPVMLIAAILMMIVSVLFLRNKD